MPALIQAKPLDSKAVSFQKDLNPRHRPGSGDRRAPPPRGRPLFGALSPPGQILPPGRRPGIEGPCCRVLRVNFCAQEGLPNERRLASLEGRKDSSYPSPKRNGFSSTSRTFFDLRSSSL